MERRQNDENENYETENYDRSNFSGAARSFRCFYREGTRAEPLQGHEVERRGLPRENGAYRRRRHKMKVKLVPTTSNGELYCKYQRQQEPQGVCLCLDLETGKLFAYYVGSNTTSSRVFHGRDLEWAIPALKIEPLADLMETIEEDCQVILEGANTTWDGSNMVGKLSKVAKNTVYRVERLVNDAPWDVEEDIYSPWEPGDWFSPLAPSQEELAQELGITLGITDGEIADKAREFVDEALTDDQVLLLEDVEEYLIELREGLEV